MRGGLRGRARDSGPGPAPSGSRGTARSAPSLAAVNSCSNCPAIAQQLRRAITRGLYQVAVGREPALVATVTKMYGLLVIEFNPIEAYDTAFPIMATPITRNLYPSDLPIPPAP